MKDKILMIIKVFIAGFTGKKNVNRRAWVFSSTDNEKFNYNSKYLFEYVRENLDGQIIPYYVINDDNERRLLQEKYGEQFFIETKSMKGIRHVLHCGVWFTSAGLPVYGLHLKKNHTIVNLWHGIPLKKIALMDQNLSKLSRLFFRYIFSDNYTYILTTSSKLKSIMAESFCVDKSLIKVWGQPRNDGILIKRDRNHILTKLYTDLPKYDSIALYAPTFRDKEETILFPFGDFDFDKLKQYLEEMNMILFIRSHISDTSNFKNGECDRVKFMNGDILDDVTEYLDMFDLLITDYSSIYIDYLLTEKPIIFLPYDKETYLKDRGMNFEYDEVTPGPKPESFTEFIDEIKKFTNGNDRYFNDRVKMNQFFNEIQEKACPVICRKLDEKLNLRLDLPKTTEV